MHRLCFVLSSEPTDRDNLQWSCSEHSEGHISSNRITCYWLYATLPLTQDKHWRRSQTNKRTMSSIAPLRSQRQLREGSWLGWNDLVGVAIHIRRVIVVYSSAFVRMMARRSRAPAPSIASVACIPTGRCWITTWSQKRALRRWRQSPSCNITPSISINPFEGLLRNHCCHLATFSYHALHDRTPLVTFTRSIRFGFC